MSDDQVPPVRGCVYGLIIVIPAWITLGIAIYWLGRL